MWQKMEVVDLTENETNEEIRPPPPPPRPTQLLPQPPLSSRTQTLEKYSSPFLPENNNHYGSDLLSLSPLLFFISLSISFSISLLGQINSTIIRAVGVTIISFSLLTTKEFTITSNGLLTKEVFFFFFFLFLFNYKNISILITLFRLLQR